MNLRETLKKFGKGVGINVTSVRVYGKQLLIALRHLESLKIVHADIKLDNILVNNNCSMVKICDFGSAFKVDSPENEVLHPHTHTMPAAASSIPFPPSLLRTSFADRGLPQSDLPSPSFLP